MMSSIFTPVDYTQHPSTMKVTTSSQDWCGHSFSQLGLDDEGGFDVQQMSYFESEGDASWKLKNALLEDEVWTKIRLNPEGLPTGKIKIIPGTFASRLRHIPLAVETATATMSDHPTAANLREYRLLYEKSERELVIYFQKEFPHEIQAWEETYVSGWGASAKKLTTKAVRKTTIKTDYWNKHSNADASWRTKLKLEQ